jgi:hypothetical protein
MLPSTAVALLVDRGEILEPPALEVLAVVLGRIGHAQSEGKPGQPCGCFHKGHSRLGAGSCHVRPFFRRVEWLNEEDVRLADDAQYQSAG